MSSVSPVPRKIPTKSLLESRAGRKAWAIAVDVSDSAAVNAACEKILADCGKIDILVNNAGVTRDGLLMRMSDADRNRHLASTKSQGAFLLHESILPASLPTSAVIINISSVIGSSVTQASIQLRCQQSRPHPASPQFVARELASRGVTVNAIAPGFI